MGLSLFAIHVDGYVWLKASPGVGDWRAGVMDSGAMPSGVAVLFCVRESYPLIKFINLSLLGHVKLFNGENMTIILLFYAHLACWCGGKTNWDRRFYSTFSNCVKPNRVNRVAVA